MMPGPLDLVLDQGFEFGLSDFAVWGFREEPSSLLASHTLGLDRL